MQLMFQKPMVVKPYDDVSAVASHFKCSVKFLQNEGGEEWYKTEVEGSPVFLVALRHDMFYSWCGYVIAKDVEKYQNLSVHGNWTYQSDKVPPFLAVQMHDEWEGYGVLGFDCGHYPDLWWLGVDLSNVRKNGVYRTKEYVLKELQQVLDQAKEF